MIKLSESVITRSPSGTATNSLMPTDFLLESKEKPLDYWLRWLNDNGIQFMWQQLEVPNTAEFGDAAEIARLPQIRNGQGWVILSLHDTEDGPMCLWGRNQCTIRNNETCKGCPDCSSAMGDATYKEMLPALMEERIHQLEQERDALVAQNARLLSLLNEHFVEWEKDSGWWDEFDWHNRVSLVINESLLSGDRGDVSYEREAIGQNNEGDTACV